MLNTNSKRGQLNQTRNNFCRFESLESRQLFSGGSLDSTFGQAGVASLAQLPNFSTTSTAVTPNGQTVLVGTATAAGSKNLLEVSRLNSDGSIDTTFGSNGLFATNYNLDTQYKAAAVALQPDGKIVVVASEDLGLIVTQNLFSTSYTHDQQWLVIRLNTNGTLDQTFGNDGVSKVGTYEAGQSIGGVAIQPDGKIVFASDVFNADNTQSDFFTVRLQANGLLDGTFGDPASSGREGWVKTALGAYVNDVDALVLQPNGKIIVGGTISDNARGTLGLIRYNADGTLDQTFNNGGRIETHFNGDVFLRGLAEDSSGEIFAVGGDNANLGNGSDAPSEALLVRYTNGGQQEMSFDNGGALLRVSSPLQNDYGTFITFPAPDKVLIAGSSSGNSAFEAQYSYTGQLDPTLGTNGVEQFASLKNLGAVAATSDGKVVLTGQGEAVRTVDATPDVSIQGIQDGTAGGINGEFTFTRDAVYDFPTRIYFQTGGTATPIVDYTGQLAPFVSIKGHNISLPILDFVDIPAGQSFVTVSVNLANWLQQSTETLTVTPLANPAYLVARGGSGTITLRNPTLFGEI